MMEIVNKNVFKIATLLNNLGRIFAGFENHNLVFCSFCVICEVCFLLEYASYKRQP